MKTNLGSAHMLVDLTDGILTVRHGTDNSLLYSRPARKGTWESIWRAIRGGKND